MILKGKTLKGKNRLRELGDEWVIISESNSVQFSTEVGPWFLIRPFNVNISATDRWVHSKHDIDFEIVSL